MIEHTPHFYLLDTRRLWPGDKLSLCLSAQSYLNLLPPSERAKAHAFYFARDARLSLASSLLKRHFIASALRTPWDDIAFTRRGDAVHGKPCVAASDEVDFNVSHQAGLVVLGGVFDGAEVGVDVVCVNERSERRTVKAEGFDQWVDMHAEVFSDADVVAMKEDMTDFEMKNHGDGDEAWLGFRLRRFYAFWCLKEAYIKMVGEGLLANWLKDVEFRDVVVPKASDDIGLPWGEKVTTIQAWFRGAYMKDVRLTLQAFEGNYMIGTAIKQNPQAVVINPSYTQIDLDKDFAGYMP